MTSRSTKLHDQLRDEVLSDPEAHAAYEAFKLQLDLAEQLKAARNEAHLTQEEVAERMHTKKTVIARLEAGGGRSKHSASIKTIQKYACAVGCNLIITVKKV